MAVHSIPTESAPPAAVSRELERLRETIGKVVGSAFYGAMLKAMRESPFKGAYGHGGRGEEVFGAQLHGLYAERLGTSTNGGLQEAVYRTLERQQRALAESAARRVDGSGRASNAGEAQSSMASRGVTNVSG